MGAPPGRSATCEAPLTGPIPDSFQQPSTTAQQPPSVATITNDAIAELGASAGSSCTVPAAVAGCEGNFGAGSSCRPRSV